MPQREASYVDVSLVALAKSRQCFHQCLPLLLSNISLFSFAHLQNWLLTYRCRQIKHSFPSDQGFFMIIFDLHIDNVHWLVKFSSSSQQVYQKMVRLSHNIYLAFAPSQTASKHRSSHVTTMSATVRLSCHRSGASFKRLFRSSIGKRPLAV